MLTDRSLQKVTCPVNTYESVRSEERPLEKTLHSKIKHLGYLQMIHHLMKVHPKVRLLFIR